jgi:hypothetical protein
MRKTMKAVRLTFIYIAAILLVGSYPISAMAETVDTTSSVSTTTDPLTTTDSTETTPLTQPTEDVTSTTPTPITESTSTESTMPKETYTFNPDTSTWDSNYWVYNPTTGAYERPPEYIANKEAALAETAEPVTVYPLTTEAGGESSTDEKSSSTLDSTTMNAITNALNSGALSGDATVKENTLAGSALTGDASAATTIINNVNSTVTNDSNQKAATFVSDVMGDVQGDILLQPMLLKAMLEAGMQAPTESSTTVSTTNQLINDITLNAQSGDAAVTGNTEAGSATTGDANTVANILNIVNSMVAANRSFVGTINIYGNLDGDILIAPDFIPQMIANNGTTSSTTSSTAVSSEDTQSIVNNIALAAESGKAVVAGNTEAGSATTGDADTNIVLFNLSGHEIVASNSLLVFVNVLGKWVGVIVDAPTGATAAAIGNGVTTSTSTSPDLVVDVKNNTQLINNINLTSLSGDATVANNTRAGGATTGNATASANIGNIVGTQMGLSDWFGVLFINVFGTWNGSFGIDTVSGTKVVSGGAGTQPSVEQQDTKQPMRVIEFVPRKSTSSKYFPSSAITVVGDSGNGNFTATELSDQPTVQLASSTKSSDGMGQNVLAALSPTGTQPEFELPWLSGVLVLTGLTLLGASVVSDAKRRSLRLR